MESMIPEGTAKGKEYRERGAVHLTDSGNAERFAAQHGANVRFCHPWGKWLVWDGRRWKIDDTGEVERLTKATVMRIHGEASQVIDDGLRQEVAKHARVSESVSRRTALLRLSQSEPPIPVSPGSLDADPWLFNVENGTIDLTTGELREHRREDFITKAAPVEYDPAATAPTWLEFLNRIFAGDRDLIAYMRRFCGYALTGDVSEQVLPIFYGTGANGKSTLIETMMALLGADYSAKAPRDLLLANRNNHPTELTILHGRRLVVCTETEDGCRVAESQVKELTGGDTISARRMREDFWQFKPTHKVVLVANHKPAVRGTDHAIWRRLALVPFTVTIPPEEQDRRLLEKLRRELPGVLRWCVAGCLLWKGNGLGRPQAVERATAGYRTEQDVLGGFLAECCVLDPGARASAKALLDGYRDWSGDKAMNARRLGQALNERGLSSKEINGHFWRFGVGMLSPRDDATPD